MQNKLKNQENIKISVFINKNNWTLFIYNNLQDIDLFHIYLKNIFNNNIILTSFFLKFFYILIIKNLLVF